MCNDEALNVVICSMNANIHVVVHKDLHEINLLNVNSLLNNMNLLCKERVNSSTE